MSTMGGYHEDRGGYHPFGNLSIVVGYHDT